MTSRYDTPAWKQDPPFYHNWGDTCRESNDSGAQAEWNLAILQDGTYTISAWWTAAPDQNDWSPKAVYEVVARGRVLASSTLDQRKDGDAWYFIAKVQLTRDEMPVVRLRNGSGGTLYADAPLVSSEDRYNDGSPAQKVLLGPLGWHYSSARLERARGQYSYPERELRGVRPWHSYPDRFSGMTACQGYDGRG